MLYADNAAALNAMLTSTYSDDAIPALISFLWSVVASRSIDLWIEWAPSGKNLAGQPSRNRELPIPGKRVGPLQNLRTSIDQARAPDRFWPEKCIPLIPIASKKGEGRRNQ